MSNNRTVEGIKNITSQLDVLLKTVQDLDEIEKLQNVHFHSRMKVVRLLLAYSLIASYDTSGLEILENYLKNTQRKLYDTSKSNDVITKL